LSYVEQRRSTRNAQNQTTSAATPPDTLSTKPQESRPTPSPLLRARSNPVTDEDSTSGQVTISGYLVDNYFTDNELARPFVETRKGATLTQEQVAQFNPLVRIMARSRTEMLEPRSMRSGYSIVYGTQADGGTMRLDQVGNRLAKTVLTFSTKSAGIIVEATGQEEGKHFKVISMKQVER
jgi:hypothetical protein